jgi:hypothetical protein
MPHENREIIPSQASSDPFQYPFQNHTSVWVQASHYRTTETMSLRAKQNNILAALTGFGALVAANYYFKPPVSQAIALRMNGELDQYNATPHPEQDRT